MKKIIFEDDHVLILYKSGNSDYLLVTFGDLVTLVDGERFSAEKAVNAGNINCIGIMAKNPNWFPQKSIIAALDEVSKISEKFGAIIMYGGSMGGYAALKYSSILKATCVIAYVPQWSIAPHDCGSNDKRYLEYYNEELKEMAITSSDVRGDAYIFIDPSFGLDRFHYEKIKDIHPFVKKVNVYSANHQVTSILAGSTALKSIVESVLYRNEQGLIKAVAEVRRKSNQRLRILIERATVRHPLLLLKIYQRANEVNPSQADPFFRSAGDKFLSAISSQVSDVEFYSLCTSFPWLNSDELKSAIFKATPAEIVRSFHSTVLVFDMLSGNLRCVQNDEVHCHHFLPIFLRGNYGLLEVNISGKCYSISFNGKFLINKDPQQQETINLVSYRKIGDYYVISCGSLNLSSYVYGKVGFNVSHVKDWEKFYVVPLN